MGTRHFSKPPKRSSVLWRNSTYRSKCTDGFTDGYWEAHHVACNHAVEGRVIEKNKDYVEDCLWITEWDLNNPDNLIGLPKNKQYRTSDGKVPSNKCSHQVDHNTSDGYTNECKQWLKDNVWDTLNDKRKKHENNAKNIKQQFEDCTDHFKALLDFRGIRKGGTLNCWDNRFNPDYKEKWYYPFSMGNDPRKRHPGVSSNLLTNIFKQIK